MGKKVAQLLNPKSKGLVGRLKPQVILLGSPYDKPGDSAVKYASAKKILQERGNTILNKKPLFYFDSNFSAALKSCTSKEKEVTVWLQSHGVPGWLFSGEASAVAELEATFDFALYIVALEEKLGYKVKNIVLDGCNTATEFCNTELPEPNYFLSPARLLSVLLPSSNVLGFVGTNVSARITHVYKKSSLQFEPALPAMSDASILFNEGRALEVGSAALELYTTHDEASSPEFVQEVANNSLQKFCLAQEIVEQQCGDRQFETLGSWQWQEIQQYSNMLSESVLGKPSENPNNNKEVKNFKQAEKELTLALEPRLLSLSLEDIEPNLSKEGKIASIAYDNLWNASKHPSFFASEKKPANPNRSSNPDVNTKATETEDDFRLIR